MSSKSMTPVNTKGEPHGYWERYWGNGELLYICVYNNGKEIGYEEWYGHSSNKLNFKTFYL